MEDRSDREDPRCQSRIAPGWTIGVDDNVGFVPLLHLDGEYRWNQKWRLNLNIDGSAAPEGRAFDVALKLKYDLSRNWTLGFGHRMLEGGVDVRDVYAFGWLPLFLGLRNPLAGLVDIVPLSAAILATLVSFRRISPLAGALLVPYCFWVSFATTINLAVGRMNR